MPRRMVKAPKEPADGQCQRVQGNKKKCSKPYVEKFTNENGCAEWLCAPHLKKEEELKEESKRQAALHLLQRIEYGYKTHSVLTIGEVYLYQCEECFSFIASSTSPDSIEKSMSYYSPYNTTAPPELLGHLDYHEEIKSSLRDNTCRCCGY